MTEPAKILGMKSSWPNIVYAALGIVGLVAAYWPKLLPPDKSMELATFAGGLIGKAMQRSGDVSMSAIGETVQATLEHLTSAPPPPPDERT